MRFPYRTLLGKSRLCGMETRTYEMYTYLCRRVLATLRLKPANKNSVFFEFRVYNAFV